MTSATEDGDSYLLDAPAEYAENPHILSWWGEPQDDAVARAIDEFAWEYPLHVSDAVVEATPEAVLVQWRKRDPVCKKYAWSNVLMYFSVARARKIGSERTMRAPKTLDCLRCGSTFRQDAVRTWAIRRQGGVDEARYCQRCCEECLFEHDLNDLDYSEADLARWIGELAVHIGVIPPANLFEQAGCLSIVGGDAARTQLMNLGARRPTAKRIRDVFGSWLQALVAAGVLPDGTHRTVRGIRSVAADGHVCLSTAERTIDDWLTAYGIEHDKEPPYPGSNYRGDFRVGETIIEFFGLAGDAGYDARIVEKRALAEQHALNLVEIYPKDMLVWGDTQAWLAKRLGFDPATRERRTLPIVRTASLGDAKPELAAARPLGPAADWYPDPAGREHERWWDGRFWTHRVRDELGTTYSDTAFPGRTEGTNPSAQVDGRPTWEVLQSTRLSWSSKIDEDELRRFFELMLRCMDAVENGAQAEGLGLASMPYDEVSQRLRLARKYAGEAAVLQRFAEQVHTPGALRPQFRTRLADLQRAGVFADPVEAGMSVDYPAPSGSVGTSDPAAG